MSFSVSDARFRIISDISKKKCLILQKNAEKFGHVKKKQYLCSRFWKNGGIAQLVRAHDS